MIDTFFYLGDYLLDLDDNVSVEIIYNFSDVENPANRAAAYSKTITIPSTPNNDIALGFLFDFGAQPITFNPAIKQPVSIINKGINVFNGIGQLLSVKISNEVVSYEIAIYAIAIDFFKDLENKLLTELDFSDYDHLWDNTNILAAWDDIENEVFSLPYTYPLIDYGQLGNADRENNPVSNLYVTNNFYPSLSVNAIKNKICENTGYNIISNFFDSVLFKKLFINYTNSDRPVKTNDSIYLSQFWVGCSSTYIQAVEVTDISIFTPTYDIVNNDIYFNGGGFSTGSNSFIAPYDGDYTFTYSYHLVNGQYLSNTATFRVTTIINGSAAGYNTHDITDLFNYSGSFYKILAPTQITKKVDYTLTAGDTIKFAISDDTLISDALTPTDIVQTWFGGETLEKYLSINEIFPINTALPTGVKQVDFMRDILKMFNLYFLPDPNNPKNILVEPYDSLFSNNILNWDDKLDINKDINIEPVGAKTFKKFYYKYKEGGGFFDKIYSNKYGFEYGRREYTNPSDFASGDDSTELIFTAPIPVLYGSSGRLIPRFYQMDGTNVKQVAANLSIFFVDMITYPADISVFVFNGVPLYKYPYAGHLDNPYYPTLDLLWGMPRELYYTNTTENTNTFRYTNNNLFNAYHRNYFNTITNNNSKLVRLSVNLDAYDLLNLDFRNRIYIKGQVFKLLSVKSNYIDTDSTEVELLLDLSIGDFTPTQFPVTNGAGSILDNEWQPTITAPDPVITGG